MKLYLSNYQYKLNIALCFFCASTKLQASWHKLMTESSNQLIEQFEIDDLYSKQEISTELNKPSSDFFLKELTEAFKQNQDLISDESTEFIPYLGKYFLKHIKDTTDYNQKSMRDRRTMVFEAFYILESDKDAIINGLNIVFHDNESMKQFINVNISQLFNAKSEEELTQLISELLNNKNDDLRTMAKLVLDNEPSLTISDDGLILISLLNDDIKSKLMSTTRSLLKEFTPIEIIKELAESVDKLKTYSLNLQGTSVNLQLPDPDKSKASKKLIYSRIGALKNLVENKAFKSQLTFPDKINLGLWGSSIKKEFPSDARFNIAHINSASIDTLSEYLTVFRQEENLKTMVHELYHLIKLDTQLKLDNKQLSVWAKNMFAIERSDDILIYEALVEAMASITNVVFSALECQKERGFDFNATLKEMWLVEKDFSILQSAKILHLSGFKSFDEFADPNSTQNRVKETTSAAEYHIIKALLLHDTNEFLSLIVNDNEKMGISSSTTLTEQVKDLITKNSRDENFKKYINQLISTLQKGEIKSDSQLYKTGRMTIIEKGN